MFTVLKNKNLKIILTAAAILLLIPFTAMQFTDEVSWTIFDFSAMGILLLAAGFLCGLTIRKVTDVRHRIMLFIVILASFMIIWTELAVGIFGTPFSGS